MPELPEVETIVRDLRPLIEGRRIARVELAWPRVLDARGLPPDGIVGERIAAVSRLGKFIVAKFAGGSHAAIHLRMTGRLIVDAASPLPYTRFVWRFVDGGNLVFADARKFGRLRVFAGDPRNEMLVGIDPFDDRLDANRLHTLLQNRKTAIKVWLLDQRFLAGIGNIYACEALWRAGVRPTKRAGRLTKRECEKLLAALRKVLTLAIDKRGSSVDDYVDAGGKQGGFQKQLAVYGRRGLPCRRCKTRIRRIVLAQRGTFFCPACQRSPGPANRSGCMTQSVP